MTPLETITYVSQFYHPTGLRAIVWDTQTHSVNSVNQNIRVSVAGPMTLANIFASFQCIQILLVKQLLCYNCGESKEFSLCFQDTRKVWLFSMLCRNLTMSKSSGSPKFRSGNELLSEKPLRNNRGVNRKIWLPTMFHWKRNNKAKS